MFGIGGFELFIILVAIFILFGPDKLPEFIKLAGAGIRKFRKAKQEMDQVLHEEIVDPVMREANKSEPSKNSEIDTTKKQDNQIIKKTTQNKSDTIAKGDE